MRIMYEAESPQKKQNYLLEGRPLVVQYSLLSECSRNPSVSVYSWRCCERLRLASVNLF